MGFPLTQQQRHAVDDRGGGLLVSAAAGSGKTRVLVERLLDRVTEEGADIDRFLVITYTKAAAAELRGRIAQELTARLAQRTGDRHLRRQTTLVYKAQISTIHAFCAALLRESGHLIDLDPDFRLCDEGEANVLKARVLGEVLDRRYQGLVETDDFAALVDTMAAGRDDSRLEQIALDVFGRIQSHPDPRHWLREQAQLWELTGIGDAGETPWGALLLEDAQHLAEYALGRLGQALDLCQGDEALEYNYAPSLSATIQGTAALLDAARARSWDRVCAALPIPFPAAGRKKGADEDTAARMKAIRSQCKKMLDELAEGFDGDSADLLQALGEARPAVRGLMALVEELAAAYDEEKGKRGLLDFSDLEHLAVRLLVGQGGGPTPLAELWSARFVEVMVDEYQDTNQVQNAIFTAISQQGRKLFMVGDVKQSIYRFRLADPTIFLEKYRRFQPWDQAQEGEERVVVLSQNFRSRPQVLAGCNDLFRALMQREFGELDYTDDQALYPGAEYPEGAGHEVELHALDLSCLKEEEGEKQSKDLLEARWAARRIRKLLDEGFPVTQGGGQRPLEPSDVMILLRSPGSVLHHYIRALGEQGIPWTADGGGDFFASTEVSVALALLRIVDNPHQDVPLIAALRSPVYGFTADDLALLRADQPGDFYAAVRGAAQRGDGACARFLKELEQLRFGAGDRTCRQLIWHIYEQTDLLALFSAMDDGETRRANLLALYAMAGQLEDAGCRTLFQFLLRLDRLRETGSKRTPAPAGGTGGGVAILSIHRSKGLEQPVVLVCGLMRRLNRDDLQRPVLFHPTLGVGPRGLDRARMLEYPTLARRAVARALEKELMAEELRLLYVAMTRAREKLILALSLAEGARTLERLEKDLSVPPAPMALERQQSVGAWVLLHALTRPESAPLRDAAGIVDAPLALDLGPAWQISMVDGVPLMLPPSRREEQAPRTEAAGAAVEGLLEGLSWRYPHLAQAEIPSKLTATQIKGRALDLEVAEEAQRVVHTDPAPIYRPQFVARERGLTPAQRGTALHLAMQYLPLDLPLDPQQTQAEMARLVERGFLTPLQGEGVDPALLSRFLCSPLGRRMAAAPVCRREFKFSVLLPAGDYWPQAEVGEEVLLQGVIDAWFQDGEGVTLVDFKSDRVSAQDAPQRGEEYRPQLAAYACALEEMLGRPVVHRTLWFFSCAAQVDL